MVVSLRGGALCILPLGTLMGRVQRKLENWKTNDVTYLSNKLKHDSPISFMKWWTSSSNKNTCLIGKANGDFLIIDLSNGSLLFSEQFSDHIKSIDLFFSTVCSFSYCIVTTADFVQWKLLLEEVHNKEGLYDKEFGFEALDFSTIHSCCILDSKPTKKSKTEHIVNPAFIPTKLYQFTESTYLKSQSYNETYLMGAYDKLTGKYKLFDCGNLDSFLYEFQLPLNVVDICVTEELLFVIVGPPDEVQLSNADLPSAFQQKNPFKLCILCRQYAQNHLFEKYKSQLSNSRSFGSGFFKPSVIELVPNLLMKCVLFEFELDIFSTDDILGIISFPIFLNFYNINLTMSDTTISMKNPNWLHYIKKLRKSSLIASSNNEKINSKWFIEEIKLFTPLFIIGRNGVTVCYLSQCFEDKFIDCLLENDTKEAEWLGAGLRLDMNYLYQYTAQLLASDNAQLGLLVMKPKKTIIVEYFDLGNASIFDKLTCLTQFWSVEDCLKFSLALLSNISNMSPIDRCTLSNSLISMFGYVMSDPIHSVDSTIHLKKKYFEKFKRFVVTNCFFNDFKAAKIMIAFGQVEEAFFIAKEKGCVVELFTFLMDNKYNTNWSKCFEDINLKEKYLQLDRDFVFRNISLTDLEIIARNDPKLIKLFGEFICESFLSHSCMWTNVLSYETITHLCMVFNPYGSIIDTLFHIYSCTENNELGTPKREKDFSVIFERNLTSSTESLTDISSFSKTFKIRRELEPSLLAFCLLVISRDSQINDFNDYIYFIQLYGVITSAVDKKVLSNKKDVDDVSFSPAEVFTNNDLFASKFSNKNFKPKKCLLSTFWQGLASSQCLALRDDLCISISVFEADLFEDDIVYMKKFQNNNEQLIKRKSSQYLLEPQRRQKCQIDMLGFRKDKMSKVLLLPKSIENGKEIIRQISLGKQHILILTDCGSVYSAGSNVHGQLGIEKSLINESNLNRKSHRLSVINPQLVNMNMTESEVVLSVCTGDFHSGAIIVNTVDSTQRSEIITWGWGVHGQLGHNDIDDQRYPKRLNLNIKSLSNSSWSNDEFPIQLTMGCYHSHFLTNKGNVYSFGNNSYGQLGISGIQKSLYPMAVVGIPRDVTFINSKYFHTVCSTSSNQIFKWGIDPNLWQNQYNQDKSHDSISLPTVVETEGLLTNEKIIQISCGSTHTTILTECKLVYSFGVNMWGQLGLGNRKEQNKLVEVKVPQLIDFISTDNGVTVGMNVGEKSTKVLVWGRCSHPLIHENLEDISTDTIKPQLLKEFHYSVTPNLIDRNSFGIDALHTSGSTILNKHQLMIFFRNCSEYLDRNRLINVLKSLNEFDIISDFFLINEMLIESLFWRIQSITERILKSPNKDLSYVILEDIEIIFNFYIRITQRLKNKSKLNAILTMITGFFKKQSLPLIIFERIIFPLMNTNALIISKLLIKYSIGEDLTSDFIRNLLLNITEESNPEAILKPSLGSIVLTFNDVKIFRNLIKAGSSETVYDAADDHKVVFFAECGHAAVLGRYREQQVKMIVDKLRKKQLNFSIPMIHRLYNDSTILPDCLECLSQQI